MRWKKRRTTIEISVAVTHPRDLVITEAMKALLVKRAGPAMQRALDEVLNETRDGEEWKTKAKRPRALNESRPERASERGAA